MRVAVRFAGSLSLMCPDHRVLSEFRGRAGRLITNCVLTLSHWALIVPPCAINNGFGKCQPLASPLTTAAAMSFSSVSVISNALRLRRVLL